MRVTANPSDPHGQAPEGGIPVKPDKRIVAAGIVLLLAAVTAIVIVAGGSHGSAEANPQPTAQGSFSASTNMPASFRPPARMSFGHLNCTATSPGNSGRTES